MKKAVSMLLVFTVIFTSLVSSAVTVNSASVVAVGGTYNALNNINKPVYLGDANGDDYVDIVDAMIVQRVCTKITVPFSEEQLMCADVDIDGFLSTVDSTLIQCYSTHIPTPYKIGESVFTTNYHGSYGIEFDTSDEYYDCERILDSARFNNVYYEGTTPIGTTNDFDRAYPWSDIQKCNIKNNIPIFEGETDYDSNDEVFVYIPAFWGGTRTVGTKKQLIVSAYAQGDLHYFKSRYVNSKLYKRSDGINPATTVDMTLSEFCSEHTCFDYETLLALTYLLCVEFNAINMHHSVNKLGYNGTIYNGPTAKNTEYGNTIVVNSWKTPITKRNIRNIVIGSQMNISDKKHYSIGKTVTDAVLNSDGTISITFDGDPISITAGQTWIDGCPQHVGATEEVPYHTGWTDMESADQSDEGKAYAKSYLQRFKYRNIEDIFGNLFTLCVGFAIENNKYIYTYDYDKATDQTHADWIRTNYSVPKTTLYGDTTDANGKIVSEGGIERTWTTECYNCYLDKAPFLPSALGETNGGGIRKKYGGELSSNNIQNANCFIYGGAFDHFIYSGMLDYRFLAKVPSSNHLYGFREIKYI